MAEKEYDSKLIGYTKVIEGGTFEGLSEPCSIFWGFKFSRDAVVEAQKIIDTFNKYGLKTVGADSPEAADLSNIVVSKSGIRTPFVEPEAAADTAVALAYITKELSGVQNVEYMSYASPLKLSQMADPINEGESKESNFVTTPVPPFKIYSSSKEETDKLFSEYGADFIERKVSEAMNSDKLLEAKDILGEEVIFRGQHNSADDKVMFMTEGKAVNLGTSRLKYANYYPYIKANDMKSYAFLFAYKEHENQMYFDDFGYERGTGVVDKKDTQKPETAIVSEKNEKIGEYLRFCTEKGMRYFPIPQDDKEWQAFKQLHRTADLNPNVNLMNRVRNAKLEARNNGGYPKTVNLLSEKVLSMLTEMDKDYEKIQEKNREKSETEQMQIVGVKTNKPDRSFINRLRGIDKKSKKSVTQKTERQYELEAGAQEATSKNKSAKHKLVALYRLSRGKMKKAVGKIIKRGLPGNIHSNQNSGR